MCPDLTEEEMRRALFGSAGVASSLVPTEEKNEVLVPNPAAPKSAKSKVSTSGSPKVVVILRVGNEFEGRTELFVHEARTLSTLQAELDATKAARKKFKYVELVSVKLSG
jgi:hypothetical protein